MMSPQAPFVASTNLNPALFQSIYDGTGVNFASKKRAADQEGGQRKNMSHLPTGDGNSSDSLDSQISNLHSPAARGASNSDAGSTTKIKKKPGRKPATTEPANKRTAQNRAAQRAFRERKERYVKELEERLAQLEDAQGKIEGGVLVGENTRLRQKISELESENRALRQMSFTFDIPGSDITQSSNTKPNEAPEINSGVNYDFNNYDFLSAMAPASTATASSAGMPISPTSLVNLDDGSQLDTSPFSVKTLETPLIRDDNNTNYALFDDIHSSTLSMTSDLESQSAQDFSDLDSIIAGLPLTQFSFVDDLPATQPYGSTAQFAPQYSMSTAPAYTQPYQGVRGQQPFTANFTNPFTTDNNLADADFDEFLNLTGVTRPATVPQRQQPQQQNVGTTVPLQMQAQTQIPFQQPRGPQMGMTSTMQFSPQAALAQQPFSPQSVQSTHSPSSAQMSAQYYTPPWQAGDLFEQNETKGSDVKCVIDPDQWEKTKDCVQDAETIDDLCELFKVCSH
ncbi:uncharacterized protein EV422DRAFT_321116 [Fimicolochytrium jonesii]|uniref:uncharacterized protein n=1 Tax=Fimicolochytrium jonesii TaxID=1396493 RepID=UPI0022FE37E2|nr:uncharacterized protein EV422DRAFT_321116 [Fimicolochytrium jonesii]KAI8824455.1 hypothetical protein EV422DRAFT_321116 [Fimicolochytrium jonesii]